MWPWLNIFMEKHVLSSTIDQSCYASICIRR